MTTTIMMNIPWTNPELCEDPAMDYLLEDALLEGLHLDEYSIDEPDIMLDVPYVPTDEKLLMPLLDLAEVTSARHPV